MSVHGVEIHSRLVIAGLGGLLLLAALLLFSTFAPRLQLPRPTAPVPAAETEVAPAPQPREVPRIGIEYGPALQQAAMPQANYGPH